jgi:NADH-quinone oxidoreductase subunit M
MANWPILSLTIFLPLAGAFAILLLRGEESDVARNARWIALWTSLIDFAVSLVIWERFDPTRADFQMVENAAWMPDFNISYHLGVDGISLFFVILSTFLTPICVLASWTSITKRVKEYMIAFLVLETLMVGMFCALDFVVFYMFFEGVLIPMFLIIGVWGGPRRVYAAFKFFLYTLLGSVLMLLAILAIYFTTGTMDIVEALSFNFAPVLQFWLWLAFFASFAVKVPMWPVHTWLPDAHVEAPTAGSVILAGVLLKMGGYGFIRFSLPMFPDASAALRAADLHAQRSRDHLHLPRRAGAGGHEEADRLFLGRPYGLRHHRHLHRDARGATGRDDPDAEPWRRVRRAVPLRRRHLRPPPYARDFALWRLGREHAALCAGCS